MRPGTLPTHQIVGMGEAYEISEVRRESEAKRILKLRETLWTGIKSLEGIYLNGDEVRRVSNNLNVSIEGVLGGELLPALSGLAVSAGSACAAAMHHSSYVLKALGRSEALALSAIRFSLGWFTTANDIQRAIHVLQTVLPKLRGEKNE